VQHLVHWDDENDLPLQPGPSHEVALEALIDASQMLTEHLRLELGELRQHQDE